MKIRRRFGVHPKLGVSSRKQREHPKGVKPLCKKGQATWIVGEKRGGNMVYLKEAL